VLRAVDGLEKVAAHASDTPAPESTTTVAPFRAWRGLRYIVAGAPTWATIAWFWLDHGSVRLKKLAEREGFEPSVRSYRTHAFQACSFDRSDISPLI
jgi:hypothetical protein